MFVPLLISLSVLGSAAPRSHEACTALSISSPQAALDYAEAWLAERGGRPAEHCLALAHLANGRDRQAADRLKSLADREREDPGIAARLYIQAAEAYMSGGARSEAFEMLRSAYGLAGDAPSLHMAAAGIYATGQQWEGVILSLSALSRHAALSADALSLRARAYLEEGQIQRAAEDVQAALAIDPYLVDALVLRGDLIQRGVSMPTPTLTE
ncbi:hypothetical protein PB2503_05417 [Parvularcula bermudensis HTCC2503]|uniref:Uncharacterized protein n=1 Tax=Parvularcula bermudensis (strain ATCC BAA-594 / HTCC2503 / KCTC 12087) TaxID=314260 RepID=E0TGB4_PARBH|nr:hypothetical protein [Parvularcula bermudensis]ADM09157.1 hypothetical protein PB2503_05417 [Parvularcula bermudensis HTCC2503]